MTKHSVFQKLQHNLSLEELDNQSKNVHLDSNPTQSNYSGKMEPYNSVIPSRLLHSQTQHPQSTKTETWVVQAALEEIRRFSLPQSSTFFVKHHQIIWFSMIWSLLLLHKVCRFESFD